MCTIEFNQNTSFYQHKLAFYCCCHNKQFLFVRYVKGIGNLPEKKLETYCSRQQWGEVKSEGPPPPWPFSVEPIGYLLEVWVLMVGKKHRCLKKPNTNSLSLCTFNEMQPSLGRNKKRLSQVSDVLSIYGNAVDKASIVSTLASLPGLDQRVESLVRLAKWGGQSREISRLAGCLPLFSNLAVASLQAT
uniref:Uncharacterized protein n=1 Tax=Sphaerodactylus townsendi TaxID=933632 RepID=A0ACB8EZ95_9SAUR